MSFRFISRTRYVHFCTKLQFKCCGGISSLDNPNLDSEHCTDPNALREADGCILSYSLFVLRYSKALYTTAFSMIPFVALVFIIAILSVNHIYD
jgi:hypothetical protein